MRIERERPTPRVSTATLIALLAAWQASVGLAVVLTWLASQSASTAREPVTIHVHTAEGTANAYPEYTQALAAAHTVSEKDTPRLQEELERLRQERDRVSNEYLRMVFANGVRSAAASGFPGVERSPGVHIFGESPETAVKNAPTDPAKKWNVAQAIEASRDQAAESPLVLQGALLNEAQDIEGWLDGLLGEHTLEDLEANPSLLGDMGVRLETLLAQLQGLGGSRALGGQNLGNLQQILGVLQAIGDGSGLGGENGLGSGQWLDRFHSGDGAEPERRRAALLMIALRAITMRNQP